MNLMSVFESLVLSLCLHSCNNFDNALQRTHEMTHFAEEIVGIEPTFDFEKYFKNKDIKSQNKQGSDSKQNEDNDNDDSDSSDFDEAIHIQLEWNKDTILSQIDLIHPRMIHTNVNEARIRFVKELLTNIDRDYNCNYNHNNNASNVSNEDASKMEAQKEAIKKILRDDINSLTQKLKLKAATKIVQNQGYDNNDNVNNNNDQLSNGRRINHRKQAIDTLGDNAHNQIKDEWLSNMIKYCYQSKFEKKKLNQFAQEIYSRMLHPKYININANCSDNQNNDSNFNSNHDINNNNNNNNSNKSIQHNTSSGNSDEKKEYIKPASLDDVRLLFLDVDGVLNGDLQSIANETDKEETESKKELNASNINVDFFPTKLHMKRLKEIIDSYDNLKIVISSTWRCHVDSLYQLFVAMDLIGINVFDRVIGNTPQFTQDSMISMSLRELEIETWLFVCVKNFQFKDSSNENKNDNDNGSNKNGSKDKDNNTEAPFSNLKDKFGQKMKQIIDHYNKEFGNCVNASKYVILDDRLFDQTQMIVKGQTYVQTDVNIGITDQDVKLTLALLK